MINSLTNKFSTAFYQLLASLRGFEETGNIMIDSVVLETRDLVKEAAGI